MLSTSNAESAWRGMTRSLAAGPHAAARSHARIAYSVLMRGAAPEDRTTSKPAPDHPSGT